ncbi:MAG: DUF3592 domain-containing protein [Chloroflexota bacterium]|nr:DUF3592 domain-containing protein [Chloroflexota bacterium]
MFGKHYEAAEATVLSAEVCAHSSSTRHTFEFILEVRPLTRQAFRTTIKEDFVETGPRPRVGDVVSVKYNPKNLQVKFDFKDGAFHHLPAHQSGMQGQQVHLSSAPGTPASQQPGQDFMQAILQAATAQGAIVEINQQPPQVISGSQMSGSQLASLLQATLAQQGTVVEFGQDSQGPAQGSFDALWQMAETHGTVLQGSQEAQLAVTQYMFLAKDLASRGESGTATILRLDQSNLSAPPLVAYLTNVYVMPSFGAAFETTFTAWINTNRHNLYDGETMQVRYDPNDHSKIVFVFPV